MEKTHIPPIKIQGIKSKLVPFIKENIELKEDTLWIEPFMGSGVVGFNMQPTQAIFCDINPHIINFYQAIQLGRITPQSTKEFLEENGAKLEEKDYVYYYEVRNRFNQHHNPLDFLFLNRSCFNGMIRFNKNYEFNTPYGHKPKRFSKAYITKITNQISYVQDLIANNDYKFINCSFEYAISLAGENSIIYCDPPYIGRHNDYYDSWDLEKELQLRDCLLKANCDFVVSTWDHNEYRKNEYIDEVWGFCDKKTTEHFYYIGGKETNRKPMVEALLIY